MSRTLSLSLSSLILSQSLFAFGTSNSENEGQIDRYCSIRFVTHATQAQGEKEIKKIDASHQDDLYLFQYKSNIYVGQYGMKPSCRELRDDLAWFKSNGYPDAYYVNYRPNESILTPLITPVKTDDEPNPFEEETLADTSAIEDEASQYDETNGEDAYEEPAWYDDIETRGALGLIYNSYSTDQTDDTVAVEGNIELKKEYEWGNIGANFALLYDFSDERRRYLMTNELYAKYYDDNMMHSFGRTIKNWGVMEAYSISDVFNTKNFLSDSFDMASKYGALNYEFAFDDEDSQYALIVKLEEREQPYPSNDNVYNIFDYDDQLETEKGQYHPTIYFRYSGYAGNDDVQSDYAVVLQHGYDNKRDMPKDPLTDQYLNYQYAYQANKVIAYGNAAFLDFILKFETAYTQVIDYDQMSDYAQVGLGLEYALPLNLGGAELKLLTEYYRYHYMDDNKSENVDFSEIFNNDVFIGARSTFGDSGTSEIKGGIALDLLNHEQVYALTFGTRMKENYRLSMEWKVFVPGDDTTTQIYQMGQFNQVTFRANYYF